MRSHTQGVPAYNQSPAAPSLLDCCLFPLRGKGRFSLRPWPGGKLWKITHSFIHSLTHLCNLNMCSEGRWGEYKTHPLGTFPGRYFQKPLNLGRKVSLKPPPALPARPQVGRPPGGQWQWGHCPVCLAQQVLPLISCHLSAPSINRN